MRQMLMVILNRTIRVGALACLPQLAMLSPVIANDSVPADTEIAAALSNGDVQSGEKLFQQCAHCHSVGVSAQHKFGPQLNGVMLRPAASADGYDYSGPMSGAVEQGLVWDVASLSGYLAAPLSYIAGTKMAFQGVAKEQERADIIAYLASLDTSGNQAGVAAPEPVAEISEPASEEPRILAREAVIPEHGVLHLGRVALKEEVEAWDIDIRPDGAGLPEGSGSVEVGGELYDMQCASCHGAFGEGEGRWPILAGGQDTLSDERPEKTIGSYWPYLSTVFDYIRRAMPFGNARSLSDDDVYALTAYLLYLNDLADEDFELTSDNFNSVQLPNEANFIADNRLEEPHFNITEEPCMTNCMESKATVTQRARILDVTPDEQNQLEGAVIE